MKRVLLSGLAAVMFATGVMVEAQAPRSADAQMKLAQQKAEVEGDLKGAIDEYRKVVAAAGSNRALAAEALVRMADCYQKLGVTEAQTIYQRVVRDFADQREQVALARMRLGGASTAAVARSDRAVWTGHTVDVTGRVSSDGRFISYVDWDDGRLMMRDLAQNTTRALTPAAVPLYSQSAQWSAISRDGKQIVYEWTANGRSELRIATLPASGFLQPRRFVLANVASFSSFDWSPDGKWIATTFERADGTGEIGVITAADGSFRSLKTVDRRALNKLRSLTSIFVSPDGKYLAYDRPASDTDQQRDVFVLAINDGRETSAVVHGANDTVMGWTPDGTRVLFSSDRRGAVGLWAQPLSGGLAQGPPELLKSDVGPAYSLGIATSGALYLHRRASTRDLTIAAIDLEAGRLRGSPVSFTQGFLEGASNPTWSPDGQHLAYPVACNSGCLAIRSVATGRVRRLAGTLTEARVAHWMPDGRSLLMHSRDMQGRPGIFQIDVESGEAKLVISSDRLSVFAQSPDGRKVYINRAGAFVERDLASESEREVSRVAGEVFGALSPDGQHIAVAQANRASNTASLLLVPTAGGQPRELLRLTHPEALFRPSSGGWTADSSALIIQKYTGSRWELWLVPVTSGQPRKLDIDPELWRAGISNSSNATPLVLQGDAGFTLSPDGRSVALVMGKTAAEVWVLENLVPAQNATRR